MSTRWDMRRSVAVPTALAGMLALGFLVNPDASAQSPRGARGLVLPHTAAGATAPGANVRRPEGNVNRLLARPNHLVTGDEFSVHPNAPDPLEPLRTSQVNPCLPGNPMDRAASEGR